MSNAINIPGTDKYIESGAQVVLKNYPGKVWICQQSYYTYNNQMIFGWNLTDIKNNNLTIPISNEILSMVIELKS